VTVISESLSGVKEFTINIGPSINKGIFAIIPESGFVGTTKFNLIISEWNLLGL